MQALTQDLLDAKTTAVHLSNEIVPKLNKASEFDDAVTEAQAALRSIRSAFGSELPDEVRTYQARAAQAALMDSIRIMSGLLDTASGAAGGVPAQDLTFRDLASKVKNDLEKLRLAVVEAQQPEGGRRRRKSRKTRKGRKGKKGTRRR